MKSVLLLLKSNSQGRCCVWPYGFVLFLSCEPTAGQACQRSANTTKAQAASSHQFSNDGSAMRSELPSQELDSERQLEGGTMSPQ